MNVRRRTPATLMFSAIAACALLAGCSTSTKGSTTTSSTSAFTPTSVLSPGGTVPFSQSKNARPDIQAGVCTDVGGTWVLRGTATNHGSNATGYQLVVDFVTKPGSTVLATVVVNVPTVQPGKTTNWSVAGAKGETNVACVLRLAQTS
jgi:hypothetical protein